MNFSICWYTPAEQPLPKLAEANKIVANDESVKWSSKPTDQIKTEIKMSRKYLRYSGGWLKVLLSKILFKNQRPPAEVAPAPSRGPSSYPQLCWWSLI